MGGKQNLSDKHLTFKVLILIGLTCTSRASSFHHLYIKFMVKPHDAYIFTFHNFTKVW